MPVTETSAEPGTRVSAVSYWPLLKRFAVRLCVAVTIAALLLVATEFYAYLRVHPNVNALELAAKLEIQQNESPAEREYWKEFKQANKVTYHPWVLWRRKPYDGQMISIDQDGIRRTMHNHCDDPSATTIWLFGDSVMWGAGARDADTIPSYIAADYEKAGHPVCIVNYAEKGYANTQEVIALMEELKHAKRKPDEVLFYDGGTEAFVAYQSGLVDVHSNYLSFKNFLDNWGAYEKAGFSYFGQTNTARFLKKMGEKVQPKPKEAKKASPILDVVAASKAIVENYSQNMDIVNLLAKQYNFRPIFAWYPNMAVGHKDLTPYEQQVLASEYHQFPELDVIYKATYDRAKAMNRPDLIYLGDLLDDQKDSLYVGISHLKPEGNQIVADHLFDILQKATGATPRVHTKE
ncbi:MAG: SGNH/GDSL hydrolase family protein [Terriglobales bacterium]